MSSFLRRSTSLARISRSSLHAYARSSIRTAGLPSTLPSVWAAQQRLQQPRHYSGGKDDQPKPPRPDNDGDGKKPEQKNASSPGPAGVEGADAAKVSADGKLDLPPGWVHLTAKEADELVKIAEAGPAWMDFQWEGKSARDIIETMKKTGVPVEMRDLMRKKLDGSLSWADSGRLFLKLNTFAAQLAERFEELEIAQRKNPSSTKPSEQRGTDRDPKQSDADRLKELKARIEERQKPRDKQGKQSQGSSPPPPGGGPWKNNDWLTTIIGTALAYWLYNSLFDEGSREITWQELRKNFLEKGLVDKLVVVGGRVRVELNREATASVYPDSVATRPGFYYYFSIGSTDVFERHLDEAQEELGIPPSERIPVSYVGESTLMSLLGLFGPTVLFVGLLYWMSRRGGAGGGAGGGMFGFGKSKAKRFNVESAVQVRFNDVAGMDEAKQEIMEFVSFLQKPEKFQRLGAKIPRGAILSGPPGTGKTLLAKATAGESGVPFFSVSGSEFVEMFVGVGASRVRDLFATARKQTPCIIFIDEIDAVGKSRSEGGGRFSGNDEREATLNQILTEMDGFNTQDQVVVLAGTNRADILDKALMRPGRFDRHIYIDRPTMSGRQDIFKVYLKKVVTNEEVEHLSGRLAALTPGFAGADIANCVNEAALVGKLPTP